MFGWSLSFLFTDGKMLVFLQSVLYEIYENKITNIINVVYLSIFHKLPGINWYTSRNMTKCSFWHMPPNKAQVSLLICTVCSIFVVTWRNLHPRLSKMCPVKILIRLHTCLAYMSKGTFSDVPTRVYWSSHHAGNHHITQGIITLHRESSHHTGNIEIAMENMRTQSMLWSVNTTPDKNAYCFPLIVKVMYCTKTSLWKF